MTKELVISASPHETKLAIVEDGQVTEIYVEREKEYGLVGSIYKGRVTRVLPGMQSAFVDVGLDRDAFLYVSDFIEDTEEYEAIVSTVEEKVARLEEQGTVVATVEAAPAVSEAPAIEPPAIEPPPAAPVEVAPPAPPAPAVAATSEPRTTVEDRRGRYGRGRRGRRRGKGFPESKYARPSYEPREPHEPHESHETVILPGESLAKYKNVVPAPAGAPEAPQAAVPESATESIVPPPQAPDTTTTAAAAPEAPAEPATSHEEEPHDSDPSASASNNPGHSPATPKDVSETNSPIAEPESKGEPSMSSAVEQAPISEPTGRPAAGQATTPEAAAPERTEVTHRWRHPSGRLRRPRRRQRRRGAPPPRKEARPQPLIADLLREGQEIIVQIVKEPLGKKGARITSHIALPGRYVVYMPTVDHVGVSRKITSDEERGRLRRMLLELRGSITGGFIVRTAAEGRSEEELRTDIQFLANTWSDVRASTEKKTSPALLHRDLNLVQRILRDQLSADYSSIWMDNPEEYAKVLDFVSRFQPNLINRVKLYTKSAPIFDEFSIQQEIDKALRPKVWLKSGGYIVINHTEALVAIDVNTGKFVGRSSRLEDTIVRTNLDAVKEIVHQIRLRDLGGIIIIDFIDMEERKNRQRVMGALEEALRSDRAPSKVLTFNEFGLVAITRKRVKQSLERSLCQPCPYCTGTGMVKSVPTICYEIQAEAKKMASELAGPQMTIRVNPDIAKALKTREFVLVEELEEQTRKNIIVQPDPSLHFEQYDIY